MSRSLRLGRDRSARRRRQSSLRLELNLEILEQRQVLSTSALVQAFQATTPSVTIFDFAHNALANIGLSRQTAIENVQQTKADAENADIDVAASLTALQQELKDAATQAFQQYQQDRADHDRPDQITDLSVYKAIKNDEGQLIGLEKKDQREENQELKDLDKLQKQDDGAYDLEEGEKGIEGDVDTVERDPSTESEEESSIDALATRIDNKVTAADDTEFNKVNSEVAGLQAQEAQQEVKVSTLMDEVSNLGKGGGANGGGANGGGANGGGANGGGANGGGTANSKKLLGTWDGEYGLTVPDELGAEGGTLTIHFTSASGNTVSGTMDYQFLFTTGDNVGNFTATFNGSKYVGTVNTQTHPLDFTFQFDGTRIINGTLSASDGDHGSFGPETKTSNN